MQLVNIFDFTPHTLDQVAIAAEGAWTVLQPMWQNREACLTELCRLPVAESSRFLVSRISFGYSIAEFRRSF